MQTNTKKIQQTLLIACGMLLTSCNGGGSTSSPGLNGAGSTLISQTPIVATMFATSTCLTGTTNFSGSVWYASGFVAITNNCSSSQTLNNQSVSFTSQDVLANNVPIGTLNAWWVNGDSYTLAFNRGSGNTQTGIFAANSTIPTINSGQTITFNGGMNLIGKANYDNKTAISTIIINGQPSIQTGSISFSIDTTKSGCTITTCSNISVAVVNAVGNTLATIVVPVANINAVYSQVVTNLPVGIYTLVTSNVTGANIIFSPNATPAVTPNSNVVETISYTKVAQTGQMKISVPEVLPAYKGVLLVNVLDIKNSNQVVVSFSAKQGAVVTTGALPATDNTHAYAIQVQGIADPLNGLFYTQNGLFEVAINANSTTTAAPTLIKSTGTKSAVTFTLSGLNNNDTATVNFQDSANKYAYLSYAGLSTGNKVYTIENGTILGYTFTASSNNYQNLVLTGTITVSNPQTIMVTYILPSTIITSGAINFHFYYGVSPTSPQDSITLTGDNYTDLIMSNYIAGVMYGHLIQEETPGIQFNKDYLYGSILGQLLQENQSTQLYNKDENYIAPLSLVGNSQNFGVMGIGQGGPYQINNYAVDMVNGSYAPAGFSLINYVAIQKNIGYTMSSASKQYANSTPASFNNKYYGPILTAYFHFNDYKALEYVGGSSLTQSWIPNNYGWTPQWQPYYYNSLITFKNLPNNFLDILLNVAYNQGFYGTLFLAYSKLGVNANATTITNANSYSMAWNGDTYQQYPYQVHNYLDQLYNKPTPSTTNLNNMVAYNNHVAFAMANLANVFSNVMQTLAYVNSDGNSVYITTTQANAAFNAALAKTSVASNATLDLSDAKQRAQIFGILENAISILETNLNTNFSSTTLMQL